MSSCSICTGVRCAIVTFVLPVIAWIVWIGVGFATAHYVADTHAAFLAQQHQAEAVNDVLKNSELPLHPQTYSFPKQH
jgi:hypothetical protein